MVRLVPDIVDADDGAAGLLIECRGWDESCLKVLRVIFLHDWHCCLRCGSVPFMPPSPPHRSCRRHVLAMLSGSYRSAAAISLEDSRMHTVRLCNRPCKVTLEIDFTAVVSYCLPAHGPCTTDLCEDAEDVALLLLRTALRRCRLP